MDSSPSHDSSFCYPSSCHYPVILWAWVSAFNKLHKSRRAETVSTYFQMIVGALTIHRLVRAVNVPAIYAIFSLLSIGFYNASDYLVPVADLYECFGLVAIFYFMINVVAPNEDRDSFFDQLELRSAGETTPGGSLAWFQVSPTHDRTRRLLKHQSANTLQ